MLVYYVVVYENWTNEELKGRHGRFLELDIFLPDQKLALEYQGEQHYYDVYSLGSKWNQKRRDQEKRILCKKNELTLIEIPFWWDFQMTSLAATIHAQRPDLIPNVGDGQPIPNNPDNKNLRNG